MAAGAAPLALCPIHALQGNSPPRSRLLPDLLCPLRLAVLFLGQLHVSWGTQPAPHQKAGPPQTRRTLLQATVGQQVQATVTVPGLTGRGCFAHSGSGGHTLVATSKACSKADPHRTPSLMRLERPWGVQGPLGCSGQALTWSPGPTPWCGLLPLRVGETCPCLKQMKCMEGVGCPVQEYVRVRASC